MSGAGTKRCCTCKQHLPLEAFGKHRGEKDGLQRQCRDCSRAADAKRYQDPTVREAHNAATRERTRQQRKDPAWRALRNASGAASHRKRRKDPVVRSILNAANAERTRRTRQDPAVRASISEYSRRRRETDPGFRAMMRKHGAVRRARSAVPLTPQQSKQVEAIYFTAAWIREQGTRVVVDHILPVKHGGVTVPENLRILPWSENARKSSRLPTEDELNEIADLVLAQDGKRLSRASLLERIAAWNEKAAATVAALRAAV